MQRLGDELGVTAMALYSHFRDKQELVDGILDRFVREADVTGHGTDPRHWRLWIRRTFLAMYRALASTPGVLPFVARSEGLRFGPAAMAALERTLGVMADAGFSRRRAIEIYTSALALALGWAMLESARPRAAETGARAHFESGLRSLLDSFEP